MAYCYFPGCKTTASYSDSAGKLQKYIFEKFGVRPLGCCRSGHDKLTEEDTAIVVCNNCATILDESSACGDVVSAWELIDRDEDFVFPDHSGEEITIQDCWIANDKPHIREAVRSLLCKMNFEVLELEENGENAHFCGLNLYSAPAASNLDLAPEKWHSADITPMEKEAALEKITEHVRGIPTPTVACYCKYCKDGIDLGGKQGIHMLDLLFGA